jgi:AcrR family transcriptional regulator
MVGAELPIDSRSDERRGGCAQRATAPSATVGHMTRTYDQTRSGTRERLLDAAAEVIADVGWSAVTSRAVADRAGVNNGVVHYHFSSMDHLRRAAAMDCMMTTFGGMVDGLAAAPTTADALRRLAVAVSALDLHSRSAAVMLEAMLHAPRDPELGREVREVLVPFRTAMRDLLARDVATGRVPATIDPAATATALVALFDGLVLHAMVDSDLDISAATDAVIALIAADAVSVGDQDQEARP